MKEGEARCNNMLSVRFCSFAGACLLLGICLFIFLGYGIL